MHSHFAGVKKNKTKQKSCFIEEIQTYTDWRWEHACYGVFGLVFFFFLVAHYPPAHPPGRGKGEVG